MMESMKCGILIVEDEPFVSEGIRFMIQRSLPEVRILGVAADGQEGLMKAICQQPDIVMTDISMPEMNGLEMIERIQEAGLDTGYVILSGYSEFDFARRAMFLGVRYYLTKPVDEAEMSRAICSVFRDVCREREERRMLAEVRNEPGQVLAEEDAEESEDIIVRIKKYIRQHYSEQLTLKKISSAFYLNPFYISQLFKNRTGSNYINYLTKVRMEEARRLLRETDLKVIDICDRVGYSDCDYFTRVFEKETGCRPNRYRMLPHLQKSENN